MVFAPSLKSKIAFNIAIILMASILLTDFVVISIIENQLVQEKVSQGKRLLLKSIDVVFRDHSSGKEAGTDAIRFLNTLFSDPAIICAQLRMDDSPVFKTPSSLISEEIRSEIDQAMNLQQDTGKGQVRYAGKTWGVFWPQKKYAIISETIFMKGNSTIVAAVAYNLDGIYLTLRQSQHIIGVYGMANLLVLTFLGFLRFSRLIVRPLDRFIKRTEAYHPEDHIDFLPDKKDHELNRLSTALNRMIQRIEDDKQKLKISLLTLEKTHTHLQNAQNEIIRAEKLASIGRLSAGIAHEIGNPLGIVLGYLGLLKKYALAPDDHKGHDYARRAEDEVNRISVIIKQLLDLSRPSQAEIDIISMHELIKDTGRRISDLPVMKDIDITYDLAAVSDEILADGNQIRQVLLNLIINAADSLRDATGPEKGKIVLSTQIVEQAGEGDLNDAPALKLCVSDNGTGISGDDIENVFDPFYTTKEPGKGTGLGLSVSYMIIEQAGGTLSVKSRVHQGTTFTICLPLCKKSPIYRN